MRMLNARTQELDEPEVAVAEILEQLDLEKNALKHSAGFLTCSYDFIESGVVKAISESLPFDVLGCTTLTNACNEDAGTMLLCLTVLTADDCGFNTVLSDSLSEDYEGAINAAARQAESGAGQAIKMALLFLPMIDVGGEIMVTALDKALKGAPLFGTIACDSDTSTYSNTYVIYNGEAYKERLALLTISGNVTPRFVVTSTSEQNLKKQQAVITSSDGSLLKMVNNMTATEYFESLGLVTGRGVEALSAIPFMVDYNDGTQSVARAIYGLNTDGSALCGGVMPEGGSLYIGRMDEADILLTAETSLKTLLEEEKINGIIMFPCLGRNMVLVVDPLAEIEVVKTQINDGVPWHLSYSGGECCPVYNQKGKPLNRFHNFTFIGCAI